MNIPFVSLDGRRFEEGDLGMSYKTSRFWRIIGVAGVMAMVAAWPEISLAQLPGILPLPIGGGTQTLTGQASAVTAVVFGNVISIVDTGTLSSASDPLGTSESIVSMSGFAAEALQAATMAWSDQVASEASLGNMALTLAGTTISADFIMSRALAVSGAGGQGLSDIEGLRIGGVPISPTGV